VGAPRVVIRGMQQIFPLVVRFQIGVEKMLATLVGAVRIRVKKLAKAYRAGTNE
jgi:hypothetical protein